MSIQTSKATIFNMAIARVGQSQFVQDPDNENSAGAINCRLFYAPSLLAVLEDFDWGFASVYATAQLVAESPNDDWDYSYRYPNDCVAMRQIITGTRVETDPPPFQIGYDSTYKLIYTDQEDAVIRYTKEQTDTTRFTPAFVNALSWRLGAEIAEPLARKKGLRQECFKEYYIALSVAEANALNQLQPDKEADASFISERG